MGLKFGECFENRLIKATFCWVTPRINYALNASFIVSNNFTDGYYNLISDILEQVWTRTTYSQEWPYMTLYEDLET
jgi:hypothetical protein